jgi:hypothetical protein
MIMKAFQLFRHRAPSSGIHLLCDPFPERLNYSMSMFNRAETLSSQREYIAASRLTSKISSFQK